MRHSAQHVAPHATQRGCVGCYRLLPLCSPFLLFGVGISPILPSFFSLYVSHGACVSNARFIPHLFVPYLLDGPLVGIVLRSRIDSRRHGVILRGTRSTAATRLPFRGITALHLS